MGARPMARVIQQHIKTPLADEVLFGRLKGSGAVRIVVQDDAETGKKKLAFIFPEGPVLPKPDREVVEAGKKKRGPREEPEVRRAKARVKPDEDEQDKPEEDKPVTPSEPLKS
jgi:ATP-dependent Clp protease ATP-binding subunit ClpA